MFIRVSICTCTSTYVHTYILLQMYSDINFMTDSMLLRTYIRMYMHTNSCIHAYILHLHLYLQYVRMYIHMYILVYEFFYVYCIYVRTYVHTHWIIVLGKLIMRMQTLFSVYFYPLIGVHRLMTFYSQEHQRMSPSQ